MTTVEKMDKCGRYLVISGVSNTYSVYITDLKKIAKREMSIKELEGFEDFLPEIIEEWLWAYSSQRAE